MKKNGALINHAFTTKIMYNLFTIWFLYVETYLQRSDIILWTRFFFHDRQSPYKTKKNNNWLTINSRGGMYKWLR